MTSWLGRHACGRVFFVGLVLGALGAVASSREAGAVDAPAKGTSRTIDAIRERGELRAAVAVTLPWLGLNPKTNEYFGPSIELGQRIASSLGVRFTPVSSTFDVMIAGLQGNKYDVIVAAMFATEKRRQVVDFVNWSDAGTCYVALKTNAKVNTLEDLNQPSLTIGTWTGSGTEQGIVGKYPRAKLSSLVIPVAGASRIEDVLTGRIDVTFLDSPRAYLVAHQYPQLKIIPGGPDYCVKNPDIPFPIGMAFNYGDPEFKKFLEAVVAESRDQLRMSLEKHGSLEYMLQYAK